MPEFSTVSRQALLFAHLLFFAAAIAEILKEDVRLLFAKRLDQDSLRRTAELVKWSLVALWASGALLIVNQYGTDFSKALSNPKIATKILAVVALTLNGFILHSFVFPMLIDNMKSPQFTASVATIFGAISTSSWLYASFVGAARYIAPYMTLKYFLELYLITVCFAICVGLIFVRPRVETILHEDQIFQLKEISDSEAILKTAA